MTQLPSANDLFFAQAGLDRGRLERLVGEALQGAEDGELFLEYTQAESFAWDDGRLKSASFDSNQGFGLRSVMGESTGYAHAAELSEEAIRRAVPTVQAVRQGRAGQLSTGPARTNRHLYTAENPLAALPFEAKLALMQDIDTYARARDPRVRQVSASLLGSWQVVAILRPDGQWIEDVRPLVRLNVSLVVEQNGRMETGGQGAGGRTLYTDLVTPESWRAITDEALRQALVNLESIPAPAGEMPVVLGPGWPGILFHEAIGHGLEGDFNRKKTSVFSSLLGERVAAPGVTVVDDGMMTNRRGSLSVDDEGTPTQRTVLIEDGILKGYMQDRLNARLMGVSPTGNGRRQSYAHMPMPRMTNTLLLAGDRDPGEILRSVKKGLYAVHFGGGQVDITSGKFVFTCTEAYHIEDGKVGAPVKGATLIGQGSEALKNIKMIGNDLEMDLGVGTCGKAGQGVPVGVGQPSLRIDGLTVGGTAA